MTIFFKVIVQGKDGKPNQGILVSLGNATGIRDEANLRDSPMIRMKKTSNIGMVEFEVDLDAKVRRIVLLIAEPKSGELIHVSGPIQVVKIKRDEVFTVITPLGSVDIDSDQEVINSKEDSLESIESDIQTDRKEPLNVRRFRRFSSDVERKYSERESTLAEVGKATAGRREAKRSKRIKIRGDIKKLLLKRVSKNPPLSSEHWLNDNKPEEKQEKVVNRGLDQLAEVSKDRRGIIVRQDVTGELPKFPGEAMTPDEARNILFPNKPPSSQRIQTLLVDCFVRKRQLEFSPDEQTQSAASALEQSAESGEEQTIHSKLSELISRAYDIALGKRPDIESINSSLRDKQFSNGPADTTAIYDYDSLQIAWKNIWDSVLDKEAVKDLTELYLEILALDPEIETHIDLTEIDELEELFDRLHDVANDLSADLEIPDYLSAWCPEIKSVEDRLKPTAELFYIKNTT